MINYRLLGGLLHLRNPPIGTGLRCMHINSDRPYENDYDGDFCRHRLSTLPKARTRLKAQPCSVSEPPVPKTFQPSILPLMPKTDKVAAYSSDSKKDAPPIEPEEPENVEDENPNAQCVINIYMEGQKGKKSYSTTLAFKDIDLKPEDIREHIRREKAAAGDVEALPPDNHDGDENKGLSLAKRLENFLLGFFKTGNERTSIAQETHVGHRPYPKLTKYHESPEDMKSIESFIKHSELTAAKWAKSEPEIHEQDHEDVAKQSRSLEDLGREKRAFRARSMFDGQPRMRDEKAYVEKIDRVMRLAMRRQPPKGFGKFMAYWKDMFGTDNISDYSRLKVVKFIDADTLKEKFRDKIRAKYKKNASPLFVASAQRIKRLKSLKFLDYKKIFNQETTVEKSDAKPPPVSDFKVELSSKGVEDYVNRRNTPGLQRKKKSLFVNHNVSKQKKMGYATDSGQGSKSQSDKEAACDKKCDDKMDKVKANVKKLFVEGDKGAKKSPCGAKSSVTTQKSDVVNKPTQKSEPKKFDLCEGVKITETKDTKTKVKPETKEKALAGRKASDIFIPSQFLKTFLRLVTKMLSLVKRVKPEIKVKASKQVHKKEFKPKYSCKQVKPDEQAVRSKQSLEKKPRQKGEVSCKDLLKKSKSEARKSSSAKEEPCEEAAEHVNKPVCNQKPCKLKKSTEKSDPCAAAESKKAVCKSEEKADPCKASEPKKSICKGEKKIDPCKATESKKSICKGEKKADPCKATEPKKTVCKPEKKADPCKSTESKKIVCKGEKKADPCKATEPKKTVCKPYPCKATESRKSVCKGEKKADPCKATESKKTVCEPEKKADPCKATESKKSVCKTEKKADPCKTTESKKSVCKGEKKADPCKATESKKSVCKSEKKADPCKTTESKKSVCKESKKSVEKKIDPCAKKATAKKPDPCAKKAAKPCKETESKKSDPCKKTESQKGARKSPTPKKTVCKTEKKVDPRAKKAADPIKTACNEVKKAKSKSNPCASKDEGKSSEEKGSQPCKFNVNFDKKCDQVFDVRKAVLKRKKKPCNRPEQDACEEETKSGGDAAKKDPCKKSYHTTQVLGGGCAHGKGGGNKCETPEDVEKISKGVIGATSKCLVQRNPDVESEPDGYPCPEEAKCDSNDPRYQTIVEAKELKQDIMDDIDPLLKQDGLDDVKAYYGAGYKNVDYFRYGKMCFNDLHSFLTSYRSPQPDPHAKKRKSKSQCDAGT